MSSGIIGYKAHRLSQIKKGEVLGLYGFGSSNEAFIKLKRSKINGSGVVVIDQS